MHRGYQCGAAAHLPDQLALAEERHDKASLEKDQPIADQILMIHAVCRALRIKLPIGAFATRYTADDWLRDRQPRLGDDLPHPPRARPVT